MRTVIRRTARANHLVQNQENGARNPQLLIFVDVNDDFVLNGGGGGVVGTFTIRPEIRAREIEIAA